MFIPFLKKIGTNIVLDTKRKLILLAVILLIVVIGMGGVAYYFWRQASEFKQNPQKAAQEEIAKTVEEVGRLIVLPEGETPTIVTVVAPEQLKAQPFFANAKKGDMVLIYTNAKRAILYDPVQRKIIEMAPLNIGNQ